MTIPYGLSAKISFISVRILIMLMTVLSSGIVGIAQPESPVQQITVNYVPYGLAWSPDGQFIAIGENLGTHLYNSSLQETAFFPGDAIVSITWDIDGTRFATAGGFNLHQGQIQVFERDDITGEFGLFTTLTNAHRNVIDVKWSPDGTMLATLSRDSEDGFDPIIFTTEIWRTSDWFLHTTLKHQYLYGIFNLSWSPDSTRIAGTGVQYICDGAFCNSDDQGVFIADVNTGERLHFLGNEAPSSITWSTANNKLAVNWPELIVYDPDAGTPIGTLAPAAGRIKWHPSGNWIASISALDRINIQDEVGQFIFDIVTGPGLWNFDWNPDGTRMVAVTENGVIQIWDTSDLISTPPDTNTQMNLDEPPEPVGGVNAVRAQNFTVQGWAVDTLAGENNGPGVDLVEVFAGTECSGTLLGSRALTVERGDVLGLIPTDDKSYATSGFGIMVEAPETSVPEGGPFTFTVCARNTALQAFDASVTRTIDVVSLPDVRLGFAAPAYSTSQEIPGSGMRASATGWAVNLAAGIDSGPGTSEVRIYENTACSGRIAGRGVVDQDRPEVVNTFGLDDSYLASGFDFEIELPWKTSFTLTACAPGSGQFVPEPSHTLTHSLPQIPSNVAVDTSPRHPIITWDDDPHAQWWRVVVRKISDNTNIYDQWHGKSAANDLVNCDGMTCTLSPEIDPANAATHDVWILAWGPAGINNAWSAPVAFTMNYPAPAVPVISGIDVNQGRATIHWNDDVNATWYQFTIYRASDGAAVYNQMLHGKFRAGTELRCDGVTCALTPNINQSNNSFKVWMRAWGPGGWSAWTTLTPEAQYTLNFPIPGTVTEFNPVTQSVGQPSFSWTGIPAATWYQLRVKIAGAAGYVLDQWYLAEALGCENPPGPCLITPDGLTLDPGSYVYDIRAWGPAGMGVYSAEQPFTIPARTLSSIGSHELLVIGYHPAWVELIVTGESPNGCPQRIDTKITAGGAEVEIYDEPGTACTGVESKFSETIPLGEFLPGTYTFKLNGVELPSESI